MNNQNIKIDDKTIEDLSKAFNQIGVTATQIAEAAFTAFAPFVKVWNEIAETLGLIDLNIDEPDYTEYTWRNQSFEDDGWILAKVFDRIEAWGEDQRRSMGGD